MSYIISAPVNPGQYKQGTVVQHADTGDYGHVVSFDRIAWGDLYELAVRILWDDGEVRTTSIRELIVL